MLNKYADRVKQLVVSVTNVKPTVGKLVSGGNNTLGYFAGPASAAQEIMLTSEAGLRGKYVVIQQGYTGWINYAEIEITNEILDITTTPVPTTSITQAPTATTTQGVTSQSDRQCLTACETNGLLLACLHNQKMTPISAIYGRLDSSTCPTVTTNHPAYSTDCSAVAALAKVAALCEGKESCTVKANNQVFGDPCPHTQKYLTVCYKCTDITTTPVPTTSITQAPTATTSQGGLLGNDTGSGHDSNTCSAGPCTCTCLPGANNYTCTCNC